MLHKTVTEAGREDGGNGVVKNLACEGMYTARIRPSLSQRQGNNMTDSNKLSVHGTQCQGVLEALAV